MKGPSYLTVMEGFANKTTYSYWCSICKTGPIYTKATETECPNCGAGIKVRFEDGDIIADATKKSKRP